MACNCTLFSAACCTVNVSGYRRRTMADANTFYGVSRKSRVGFFKFEVGLFPGEKSFIGKKYITAIIFEDND